jgi:uncharacterized protein
MRVVLDTNIVLSGLLWRGAPSKVVAFVADGHATSWTSETLLEELAGVLARSKHADTLLKSGYPASEWVKTFADMSNLVVPAPIRQVAPDPDDDWVIATAIAANADLIVTGDKPFLGIGQVGAIKIVSVHDALALIDAAPPP